MSTPPPHAVVWHDASGAIVAVGEVIATDVTVEPVAVDDAGGVVSVEIAADLLETLYETHAVDVATGRLVERPARD